MRLSDLIGEFLDLVKREAARARATLPPSAGSLPSRGEERYDEAERAAKGEKPPKILSWRW